MVEEVCQFVFFMSTYDNHTLQLFIYNLLNWGVHVEFEKQRKTRTVLIIFLFVQIIEKNYLINH